MINLYSERNRREVVLTENGTERYPLSVSDKSNLSDKELDEMPFGISTSFSRFYDVMLVETDNAEIYFSCNEVSGCFDEPVYVLKLNSFPDDLLIKNIKNILFTLNTNKSNVKDLRRALREITDKLGEYEVIINEFDKNDLENNLIDELRGLIRSSIEDTIQSFSNNYSSKVPDGDLLRIIKKVKNEFC